MTGTTIIAIYAATLTTAGLVWQIYTWGNQHRTRVRVEKRNAVVFGPMNALSVLSIRAVNRSGHSVHVAGVGLMTRDRKLKLQVIHPVPGATLPGTLAPRTSGAAFVDLAQVERDGYEPDALLGYVELQTGEIIVSRPPPRFRIDIKLPLRRRPEPVQG